MSTLTRPTLRQTIGEFARLGDRYYWLTAYMIAQNAITRHYKNSFLGVAWTVLQPLIQVTIFAIVMPLLMRFPVKNYVLYLVVSYPLWALISTSLVQSSQSLIAQAETLKRCMVSSTVFPIADVLKNLYTYCVSFLTMYGFCLLFLAPLNPLALLVPLYLIPILIMLISMAVAIAFMAPYIRDIGELTVIAMSVAFWLTPVIYPLKAVPEEVQWVFWLNPFFIMMHPIFSLIYDQQLPGLLATCGLLGLTAVVVAVSYAIYRACRRNYVYYL